MNTPRIPVTVVTGFLGAGKTTLLSNLIRDSEQRRLAILVNEFGEVSIDGALLREGGRADSVEIHDLSNGLIAYGDGEDFLLLMQALWARRSLVDHVLIETSGLALPTAVMESLQGDALAPYFVLDATLAVVDTPLLLAGGFNEAAQAESAPATPIGGPVAGLFKQQLDNADIVVLNKIDALEENALLAAEARVRALAPAIRFIELAQRARLDTRLTLGLHLHEPANTAHRHYSPVSAMPARQSLLDGHSHGGLGAHIHGLATHKHFHEHDPGWQSFMIRSKDTQDTETLRQAIIAIASSEPILRIKGFANADCGRVLIQAVRSRVETRLDAHASPAKQAQLVFIGYHPSRPRLVELLSELTGKEWR